MITDEIEDQIEIDLTLAAAWCEYKFPSVRPIVLFAACQHGKSGELALVMADYLSTTTRKGPIVEEAYRAMTALGYKFDWRPCVGVEFVLTVSTSNISNHERLTAVWFFTEGAGFKL